MSTKASTAALEPLCKWRVLLQRRTPRHPAGGFLEAGFVKKGALAGMTGLKGLAVGRNDRWRSKETAMDTQPVVVKKMQAFGASRTIRRRLIGAVLLVVGTLAIPVVAAAAPVEYKKFGVPKLDRRAIENLQRWVNDGHDEWCKEPQLVASMEMRRMAPDFAGYQFDLASLPLEKELSETDRMVFRYTSLDGHTMYRITLRRYAWLLPIAGKQKSIVWVPARTEIVTKN